MRRPSGSKRPPETSPRFGSRIRVMSPARELVSGGRNSDSISATDGRREAARPAGRRSPRSAEATSPVSGSRSRVGAPPALAPGSTYDERPCNPPLGRRELARLRAPGRRAQQRRRYLLGLRHHLPHREVTAVHEALLDRASEQRQQRLEEAARVHQYDRREVDAEAFQADHLEQLLERAGAARQR